MKLLILAGGKGRRIGGKKATRLLLNKPLIYWVYQKLKSLPFPIYISVKNASQEEEIKNVLIKENIKIDETKFIKDAYPEIEGPLSGIVSALKNFPEGEGVLVVAVDQPLITKEFLEYLIQLSYLFCNKFLIVTQGKDKIRPFPGIYPCSLRDEIKNFFLSSPKKSLFRLFQYLSSTQCVLFLKNNDKINDMTFFNINTHEDLSRVEKCFFQKLKIPEI